MSPYAISLPFSRIMAVIAAILAFLISTVPGNLLLSSAFDRVQQEVTTHLPSGIKDQLG